MFVTVSSPTENVEALWPTAHGRKIVVASAYSQIVFEKLEKLRGLPQTKLTYVTQVNMGGFIPSALINLTAVSTLMYASHLRKEFDKSTEIDKKERDDFVSAIASDDEVYSDDEKQLFISSSLIMEQYENSPGKKSVSVIERAKGTRIE